MSFKNMLLGLLSGIVIDKPSRTPDPYKNCVLRRMPPIMHRKNQKAKVATIPVVHYMAEYIDTGRYNGRGRHDHNK